MRSILLIGLALGCVGCIDQYFQARNASSGACTYDNDCPLRWTCNKGSCARPGFSSSAIPTFDVVSYDSLQRRPPSFGHHRPDESPLIDLQDLWSQRADRSFDTPEVEDTEPETKPLLHDGSASDFGESAETNLPSEDMLPDKVDDRAQSDTHLDETDSESSDGSQDPEIETAEKIYDFVLTDQVYRPCILFQKAVDDSPPNAFGTNIIGNGHAGDLAKLGIGTEAPAA